MEQVYKVDEKGYYVEPVIAKTINNLPSNYIATKPPQGLYRARWTGKKWIEDMTQEEIEELHNRPAEPTETELVMLAIADLDLQREQDKIETQLAIAELAETILGGVE